jgi:exopolysaccharide biosynthesis protein
VVSEGAVRNPVDKPVWIFWLDPNGQGHIASVKEVLPARIAIAGFSRLLREGKVLPKAAGPLHPRTALGVDATGRLLMLVVVDGRQPGLREGMSEYELAELLAGLGCQDALNLDGGGSSVMLMADSEGKLQIVNRPSGSTGPQPVPVMMGVGKSLKKSDDSR